MDDPAAEILKGHQLEDSRDVDVKQPEPSTLQWPEDRKTAAETDGQARGQMGKEERASVRSSSSLREASSWTESERGPKTEWDSGKVGGEEDGAGLWRQGGAQLETEIEVEAGENLLPEKAAQVFRPTGKGLSSTVSPRDTDALWEKESERSPFLDPGEVDYNQHGYQYEFEDTPPSSCNHRCSGKDALKVGVSLMTSAFFFPLLVWGGYVFLPFDAPLLDSAPLRLVYTLRCSVFAAAPIVLGWLVLGVSRLRSGATKPAFLGGLKEAELQEVVVHQRFISDSASLFLIYFLQLVVMAMYLTQEQLKLVPLLAVVFAFGRLAYWLAAALGSSLRGFGFGLSFLPSLVMMAANFYFIFTVEAAGSIFSVPSSPEQEAPPTGRQRFFG